jgi:hypothetical protein
MLQKERLRNHSPNKLREVFFLKFKWPLHRANLRNGHLNFLLFASFKKITSEPNASFQILSINMPDWFNPQSTLENLLHIEIAPKQVTSSLHLNSPERCYVSP